MHACWALAVPPMSDAQAIAAASNIFFTFIPPKIY
jgi:hypothetical protein